ncbi:MAG: hypothetical protein IKQ37_06750 [Bacteroidaceae bacterium]|nr:hypothetical protein [Bacteroidaceae bacterium]
MKSADPKSLTNWHYVKLLVYWLLMFIGIALALFCADKIMCYCGCKDLDSAAFVISTVALVANIGLLVIWGLFIKELILQEYNNYHKVKLIKEPIPEECYNSLIMDVNKLKSEMEKLKGSNPSGPTGSTTSTPANQTSPITTSSAKSTKITTITITT